MLKFFKQIPNCVPIECTLSGDSKSHKLISALEQNISNPAKLIDENDSDSNTNTLSKKKTQISLRVILKHPISGKEVVAVLKGDVDTAWHNLIQASRNRLKLRVSRIYSLSGILLPGPSSLIDLKQGAKLIPSDGMDNNVNRIFDTNTTIL